MTWQPIETAPKDEKGVLLWWVYPEPRNRPIAQRSSIRLSRWVCCSHYHSGKKHNCPRESDCRMTWMGDLMEACGYATHWMPLPDPPKEA